ncbi:MAG: glucose/galactose MFS transporter [Flavobacteriales bacterium]|nr:MAG: glucose/galactose MFS transporter [Flavobacteriales bacterium]
MTNQQGYKRAFIVITSLFFMWGFITVLVDSLIPRLKEIFEIDNTQAVLVQFAFFGAYGLLSIPAGNLLHKIGYKKGIMLGLGIMGLGSLLFLPAASMRLFSLFMLGYFILAAGMVILQVAANPYVAALGDEKTASSRLNLAQAFNSLGTTIAPILGAIFILSDDIKSSDEIKVLGDTAKEIYFSAEAAAVQMPFLILAISLLVLAAVVFKSKLPQLLNTAIKSNYGQALKHTRLRLGAVGIFFYVGAEVAIGSFLVNYFLDMELADVIRNNGFMSSIASLFHGDDLSMVDDKGIVGSFNVLYWGGAMVGRFIGSYLTKVYQPQKVLSLFSMAAILLIVISMSTSGLIALWAVLAVGLFNSIMFPTIFSLAIEGLGDLKPQGSGLLCTAIVGGAFVPLLFGYLSVEANFKVAFISAILCYAYIFFFSKKVSVL